MNIKPIKDESDYDGALAEVAEMIRRLHAKFGIPAESLIQPTIRRRPSRRRRASAA